VKRESDEVTMIMYFTCMCENRIMKSVKIALKEGKGDKKEQ
jgi:hypothetical protein